ncbi:MULTISPECIES: glycoside hydrolase family protein [Variovorax]|uniref:glycoside hydrolase family protein n=1 Tax=Variovorax TaxID=34072 RepID=UPI00285AD766|nr:lysozyme [Variovorax sp. 3319]MDR6887900.1 GH24 family phage-related lysozyme (muramidase) [Variovorax sp. 3319]
MKSVRTAVAALTLSAAGFAAWVQHEGSGLVAVRADGVVVLKPYVPTQGDVPTIGHGSTRYEDGTRVTLADPPITRRRAAELARNLNLAEERRFAESLPGVQLTQEEFDLYMDFIGQYGMPNWLSSSMRGELLAGRTRAACDALLRYRFQAGRDCALPQNWGPKGCKGVWLRQQARHGACIDAH